MTICSKTEEKPTKAKDYSTNTLFQNATMWNESKTSMKYSEIVSSLDLFTVFSYNNRCLSGKGIKYTKVKGDKKNSRFSQWHEERDKTRENGENVVFVLQLY